MSELIKSLEIKDLIALGGIILTFIIGLFNLVVGLKNTKRTTFVNAVTTERVKWMGELKSLLSEYLSIAQYYEDKPFFEGEEKSKYFEKLIFLQNKIKLHLNYIDAKDEEINKLIKEINDKIFGIYDMKKLIDLPREQRFLALPIEKQQEYFDKVIKEKFDKETLKNIFIGKDRDAMLELLKMVSVEADNDVKDKYGYKGRDELINKTNKLVEKSRVYLKVEWEKVKEEARNGKLKKQSHFDRFIKWLFQL